MMLFDFHPVVSYNYYAETNETRLNLRRFWHNLINSVIVKSARFVDVMSRLVSATSQTDRAIFIGRNTKQKAAGVMVGRLHLRPGKDYAMSPFCVFILTDTRQRVKYLYPNLSQLAILTGWDLSTTRPSQCLPSSASNDLPHVHKVGAGGGWPALGGGE